MQSPQILGLVAGSWDFALIGLGDGSQISAKGGLNLSSTANEGGFIESMGGLSERSLLCRVQGMNGANECFCQALWKVSRNQFFICGLLFAIWTQVENMRWVTEISMRLLVVSSIFWSSGVRRVVNIRARLTCRLDPFSF